MRRRETTLDPAVTAELEALEAALVGDPAAEPELTALVRDVRAQAPAMDPGFRARLDERAERGFATAPRPKRQRRNLVPALGIAGCLLAGIVAIALTSGGSGKDNGSSGGGAGAVSTASGPVTEQAQKDAAGGAGTSSSAAAPAAPQASRSRKVERSTRLELTTTDVQDTADGVVRATQASGGFVQSSQVASGDGNGNATFVLRVPTARLDDAIARLSKLGHVRSLQQSSQDITGAYDSASTRLAEARAERRGLLRAIAKATTAQEISSLRARIADNRREIARYQREFEAVRNRANYATVEVDVTGRPHKSQPAPGGGSWSPGDAAHDAVRVLEVSAGVALIGLAVLVPLALLGAAAGLGASAYRRRRREAALST